MAPSGPGDPCEPVGPGAPGSPSRPFRTDSWLPSGQVSIEPEPSAFGRTVQGSALLPSCPCGPSGPVGPGGPSIPVRPVDPTVPSCHVTYVPSGQMDEYVPSPLSVTVQDAP